MATSSTVAPRRSAPSIAKIRPSVGVRRAGSAHQDASSGSGRVQKPAAAVSTDRRALPNASGNDRPSAIASPTLFIVVVSSGSAPGNFSNANRGTFTTT